MDSTWQAGGKKGRTEASACQGQRALCSRRPPAPRRAASRPEARAAPARHTVLLGGPYVPPCTPPACPLARPLHAPCMALHARPSTAHLKHAVPDLQDGDVKGAAAQVKHQDGLVALALKAVREGRGGRLVDDPEHLEARDLACAFEGGG